MRKQGWMKGVAAVLAAAMVLSGCGGAGESRSGGDGQTAQTQAGAADAGSGSGSETGGGVTDCDITLGEGADIKHMDPQEAGDIYSMFIIKHLYSRLFKLNQNNEIECELAESYEVVDDLTYHIVLRQGVKFHDGSELKASDVKFTLERAKEKANTKANAKYIDTVTISGDYDLTITTTDPYPSLFYFLSGESMSIVSEAVVTAAEANGGIYEEQPVGTGPFKFMEWAPNDHWALERFDEYFGGPAKARSITCRIIPEASSRVIALETGEIDVALNVGAVEAANVEANPDLVLESGISPAVSYLGLNAQKGALADERVRQALAYSIDKQEIVDTILEGRGEVANSFMGKTIPGWNESLEPYPRDVEKAKALLAEAGYGDGLKLELFVSGDQNNRTAQIIQAQLLEAGIEVEISMYEWGALTEAVKAGKHDMFIMGWANRSGDPDYSMSPLFHSSGIGSNNNSFIADDKLDEMILTAKTDMDSERRMQEYKDIQVYLKELSPWVPLYYSMTTVGRRADLQGFEFNPATGNYAGDSYYEK